jgi:monoamine oxidase
VGTFPTHNEGENVLVLGGRRSLYAADPGLSPDPQFQEAILRAITRLDPMVAEVPIEAPWKARRAEEWDDLTLEAWKQQNLSREGATKLFDVACEAIWGAEPREISLLYALVHRRRGERHGRGDLRQADQHAGRRAAVAVRRRLAAHRAARGTAAG